MRIGIEARDLQVGDRLASGQIVKERPSRGLKTPTGKVDIVLEGRRGEYVATWGARTEIGVDRPAAKEVPDDGSLGACA